jgi:hypothetical protein
LTKVPKQIVVKKGLILVTHCFPNVAVNPDGQDIALNPVRNDYLSNADIAAPLLVDAPFAAYGRCPYKRRAASQKRILSEVSIERLHGVRILRRRLSWSGRRA